MADFWDSEEEETDDGFWSSVDKEGAEDFWSPIKGGRKKSTEFALSRGIKGASSLGTISGYKPDPLRGDAPLGESLMYKAGALLGDAPAFSVGSTLGIAAGAAIGGPFTALALGGAGMFMLPEFIKQLGAYARKKPNDTLVGKLGDLFDVGKHTVKHGAIGAATGIAGAFAPLAYLAPGLKTLAGSKLGKEAINAGIEFAAMQGTQSLIEGELPTGKDLIENAMLIGAMKGVGAGRRGVKKAIGAKLERMPTPKTAKTDLGVIKKTVGNLDKLNILKHRKFSEPHFKNLRKVITGKNKEIVESQFKWQKGYDDFVERGNVTKESLKDVKYYMERTPNPEIEGDTKAGPASRLDKGFRKFLDTKVRSHFEDTMKAMTDDPYIKTPKPRPGVKETYVPHFFENFFENPELLKDLQPALAKKVGFKNRFSNMRQAMDYFTAAKEMGLKPRFADNPFEMLKHFDKVVAKMKAASQMIQLVKENEKATGKKLIVTKHDGIEPYRQAQAEGYLPYEDISLRSLKGDGLAKYPTEAPAMVAPELAGTLPGLFTKRAFVPTPINEFLRKSGRIYDTVADTIRTVHVKGSFFHYGPIMESYLAAPGKPGETKSYAGLKKMLSMNTAMAEGGALIESESAMKDAAKSGVIIHRPMERWETAEKMSQKMTDAAIKYLPEEVVTKAQNSSFTKGLQKYAKAQEFLFKKFHPRLKMLSWKNYVDNVIFEAASKGEPLTEQQVVKVKENMADLVNNQFGGQNWEIQRVFNNPQYKQWLRRVIAYPDWSTSALRQAAGAASGGLKGREARKYWLRFGINAMLVNNFLRFSSGGWYQSDKKDKSFTGIRFSVSKAWDALTDPDPSTFFKFPLPDIPFNVFGMEVNPGRDLMGSRLFTHFGKQALEIKDWYKNPMRTLFTKSNPLIRIGYSQILGQTPSDREPFITAGEFKKGFRGRQPWNATEPGSGARVASRAKELVKDLTPFGLRTLLERGAAPWLTTGLGSVPISKGISPYKAGPLLDEAFSTNNNTRINKIRKSLRDNGYTYEQIKNAVNSARRRAKA